MSDNVTPVPDISQMEGQLCALKNSEIFTAFMVISLAITLTYVCSQKNAVICAIEGKQVTPNNYYCLRVFGSLLIVSSLIFFLQLSENEVKNSSCPTEKQILTYSASFLFFSCVSYFFYLLLKYK